MTANEITLLMNELEADLPSRVVIVDGVITVIKRGETLQQAIDREAQQRPKVAAVIEELRQSAKKPAPGAGKE